MLNKQKCAVIGCGNVGATSAFALLNSGLFNEIVLIDVAHKKAVAEALDLNHGMPLCSPTKIYVGSYEDLHDCGLVIITAGAPQKPGEPRLNLLKKNAGILNSIVPEVVKYNKECILLLVANPVDVLTKLAIEISGFPTNRVFGTGTVLDSYRMKYFLGDFLNTDSANVNTYIIGEHGDSSLPVWSNTTVGGIPLVEYSQMVEHPISKDDQDEMYTAVRNSAYAVIEGKGATYYAIAMSVLKVAKAIVRDEKAILPVTSYHNGIYGLEDVCLGLPTVVGANGVEKVLELPINEEEMALLKKSAETLKRVRAELDA